MEMTKTGEILEAVIAYEKEFSGQAFRKSPEGLRLVKAIAALKNDPAKIDRFIAAAGNLAHSEPSYDDERLSYVEVQVERDELKEFTDAKAAL
jgi:hypothetical protein